jgi:hypothetical protein
MFAQPSQLGSIARRLACLVLVLWLAGVGCIIGCEMNTAAALAAPQAKEQTVTEDESCDASARKNCCHKKKGDGQASLGTSQTGAHSSCCPLAAISADPGRKLGTKDAPAVPAESRLPGATVSRIPARNSSYKLRVPDRGSTHLRLCVFLI